MGRIHRRKYAAPNIRPGGSITFSSSIIVARPSPTTAASASATGAIEALTRGLAVQLAPIRVNTVRLGPLGRRARKTLARGEPDEDELFRRLRAKLLTGRLGTPDEVATAYVHLMHNGFCTGTGLATYGGYVLV